MPTPKMPSDMRPGVSFSPPQFADRLVERHGAHAGWEKHQQEDDDQIETNAEAEGEKLRLHEQRCRDDRRKRNWAEQSVTQRAQRQTDENGDAAKPLAAPQHGSDDTDDGNGARQQVDRRKSGLVGWPIQFGKATLAIWIMISMTIMPEMIGTRRKRAKMLMTLQPRIGRLNDAPDQ